MNTILGFTLCAALGLALLGGGFAMAQTVSQPGTSDAAPIIFLKPGQTVATVSQSGLGPVGAVPAWAIHTPAQFLKPGQSPLSHAALAP